MYIAVCLKEWMKYNQCNTGDPKDPTLKVSNQYGRYVKLNRKNL